MSGWLKHLWRARKDGEAQVEPEDRPRVATWLLLDKERAAEQHLSWQRRLRDVIQGESQEYLDVEGVSADVACGLGKWIHNAGQANYGYLPAFQDLRVKHAALHAEAGIVLEYALEGRRTEAQRQLVGPFMQRYQELLLALDALEEVIYQLD